MEGGREAEREEGREGGTERETFCAQPPLALLLARSLSLSLYI
jgi:hypothetical protein